MYLRPLTERAAIRFGRLPDRTSQLGMAANILDVLRGGGGTRELARPRGRLRTPTSPEGS